MTTVIPLCLFAGAPALIGTVNLSRMVRGCDGQLTLDVPKVRIADGVRYLNHHRSEYFIRRCKVDVAFCLDFERYGVSKGVVSGNNYVV